MTKHSDFGQAAPDPADINVPFHLLEKKQRKAVQARIRKHRHAGHLIEHHRKQNPRLAAIASRLVKGAATRAVALKVPFDLDVRKIFWKLKTGLCEVTDLPLDTNHEFRVAGRHRSPFTPTLDRNVPELGYVGDNVRVVCWVYNAAKGEASDADVMRVAEALVRKRQRNAV